VSVNCTGSPPSASHSTWPVQPHSLGEAGLCPPSSTRTATTVERHGNRWYYRRSIALSNAIHTSCAMCHTNFTPQFFKNTNNPGQWVGALTLRVPIKEQ
jgi:hypothetical protein